MRSASWSALVASVDPGRVAVVDGGRVVTFGELRDRAAGLAAVLDQLGAPVGRPVAAAVDSSPDALALVVAGAATGRPVAPLNPRHTTLELDAVCRAVDPAVVLDVVPSPSDVPAPRWPDAPRGDALVAVLHTSGTTGAPRVVPVRQERLVARVELYRDLLGLDGDSVLATTSPFHHTTAVGMAFVTLGLGAAWIGLDRFSVEGWTRRVARRATHAIVVPTMVERLLDAGALDASTAPPVLVYGGAPMPPGLMRRLVAAVPGIEIHQIYGQTEGSPLFHLDPGDHRRIAAGDERLSASVGRAVPGVTARIADAGPDGVGEVHARGPHLFSPGPDGWLRTGDLGVIEDDGHLFLAGRLADRIVRGGENVDPGEVETVLASHPDVADVAVVGVPDERGAECVMAFVVPSRPGTVLDLAALSAHVRTSLAGYKVPTRWATVDVIPRNDTGKILRRRLVER